jgi:hypothetical protein
MKARTHGPGTPTAATAAIVVALFVATLFLFGPAMVYLTNAIEFSNSLGDLAVAGAVLALVASILLAAVLVGLKALGAAFLEKGLALIFALGFLLWFQGNFLLWNYGPLDGRAIPWSAMARFGIIDGLVWLGALVAAFVLSRPLLRFAGKVGLALIAVQLAYGAVLFLRQPETPSFKRYSVDTADEFVFSRSRNIIVLILDSFQTDVFDEIVRETPNITAGFDGFTYFRNALGGYPFTELSVALMLTGRFYDDALPFEEWKKEAYGADSLPRVLKANGWRVDLFPKVSFSLSYSDKVASNFVKGIPRAERMLDVAYILDLGLFRSLPHFLKRRVHNDQNWFFRRIYLRVREPFPKFGDARTRVIGPKTRGTLKNRKLFSRKAFQKSQDIKFVDAMLSEARLGDDRSAFKFYHIGGPHIPLVLDENLDYAPMSASRENYRKAATASLKLTAMFLERLRKLGVYDGSMIFIVGDHGAGFQGQEFIPRPGSRASGSDDLVTQPARINALPLILVKPFASIGSLRTSDAPVSLADIPATAFRALGLDIDAPGESMFSVDASAARERRYLMYSGRDIYSYYGDMDEYLVSGPSWEDGAWRRSGKVFTRRGTVFRRRETYRYGSPLDMKLGGSGLPYLEYGWHVPDTNLTWTAGRRALMVLPVEPRREDMTLSVTFRPHWSLLKAADREVIVTVNGTRVGRWSVGTGPERTCQATIPGELAGDALRILFEVPGAMAAPESVKAEDILKLGIGITRIVVK